MHLQLDHLLIHSLLEPLTSYQSFAQSIQHVQSREHTTEVADRDFEELDLPAGFLKVDGVYETQDL